MAVLIPEAPGNCTRSERQVFRRLEHELPDHWVVLHSLGLAKHHTKLWGETDFVVISTKGIFVLEVKGGTVACRDGYWHFGDPGSPRHYSKKEGPFEQAKSAMFCLKDELDKEEELGGLLLGYGVVMPYTTFTQEGPEIEQQVLLDARKFGKQLGSYIGQLGSFWQSAYLSRHGREPGLPTRPMIQAVRQLLRPDLETALSLSSYMNGLEEELLHLTNRQIVAARGIANNTRCLITGRAGTGKTVLAVERARDLATDGKKVSFVCYNKLLAQHIAESLDNFEHAERITVRHLHGLMRDEIVAAGLGDRLESASVDDNELYERVFPEIYIEAALATDSQGADVLIVDEAQDLLRPNNIDIFDLLVRDGIHKGNWVIFHDPRQNIYESDIERSMAEIEKAGFATYELFENCRNTRPIAVQTSIVSGIDMALDGAVGGLPCDCIFYSDPDDAIKKLDAEVRRLLNGGLRPNDLILLSPFRKENSLIAGENRVGGLDVCNLPDSAANPDCLAYSTIHSFKGLERRVVLALDLKDLGEDDLSKLHYAGLSRAIGILRPFVPSDERRRYELQAESFGDRLAGGEIS